MSRTERSGLASAAVALVVVLGSSCSTSPAAAREGGFEPGPLSKRVTVWVDSDGAYTCPPGALILTSEPSQCGADWEDRVRLRGHAIRAAQAALERAPERSTASVEVTGRVADSGYEIEVSRARPVELDCALDNPAPGSPCRPRR